MGIYLNPGNMDFQEAVNSEIYIDKSLLISYTNKVLRTNQKYICVSRPRRFGKSTAANMLTAYYSLGCDSEELFDSLKVNETSDFHKHLNKYNVIHINMQEFLSESGSVQDMISDLQKAILFELTSTFDDVKYYDDSKLLRSLRDIFARYAVPFIFIIDEWDCIFRIQPNHQESQKQYLDFLRYLFKDQSYVALVYMTGILPIKKYGQHSALNMFSEFSMTNQRELSEFTGFTEAEVMTLCEKYHMPFDETKRWYDGYQMKNLPIYNPRSVVMSMTGGDYDNYWTQTETYEALKVYIQMDFDNLRTSVVKMISGEKITINPAKFQNDMTTFQSADDVLTLLVHLGYLTYDFNTKQVWIPNSEVHQEFINCIEDGGWVSVMNAIHKSDDLLAATLSCDNSTVARQIEKIHQENTSLLQYNDENSLACIISLAYYSAKRNYSIYRELPAGKGFADLVFIPKSNCSLPALVVELKWNKSVDTAIKQILDKEYTGCLQDYTGEILLVGINYDIKTKKHECEIRSAI